MLAERTQTTAFSVEHDVREPAAEMGLARHAREDLGRRPRSVGPQDDLDRVLHRAVAEGDDDAVGRVEALDPGGSPLEHVELRLAVRRLRETVAGAVRGDVLKRRSSDLAD